MRANAAARDTSLTTIARRWRSFVWLDQGGPVRPKRARAIRFAASLALVVWGWTTAHFWLRAGWRLAGDNEI